MLLNMLKKDPEETIDRGREPAAAYRLRHSCHNCVVSEGGLILCDECKAFNLLRFNEDISKYDAKRLCLFCERHTTEEGEKLCEHCAGEDVPVRTKISKEEKEFRELEKEVKRLQIRTEKIDRHHKNFVKKTAKVYNKYIDSMIELCDAAAKYAALKRERDSSST